MIRAIEAALEPTEETKRLADPAFRILTSLIFIVGGLGHFGRHEQMLRRIDTSPWVDLVRTIGDPSWLLWLSGGVFVVAGTTLALGWMTRLSAIALFVTLVPITLSIHIAPGHVGPLFKNVAILGALGLIWTRGSGAYAFDNRAKSAAS